MAHAEKGKAAEGVDQGAAEVPGQIPVPHVTAISVKAEPGQVDPDKDHSVVKKQHVPLGYQDRRQAEGVSDHIILQGREQVRPVAHVQVEGGKSGMS